MRKNMLGLGAICAFALAATQGTLAAAGPQDITGVWDVSVTVKNCQSGAIIRTVRSIQKFDVSGAITETADTATRGISFGNWKHTSSPAVAADYWFFRYNQDGSFASFATVADTITLSQDGTQFTSSGSVKDFDQNNYLLNTGCFTHSAKRLVNPAPGH